MSYASTTSSASSSSTMSTVSPRSHPMQIHTSASGSPRSATSTAASTSTYTQHFASTSASTASHRRGSITAFNSATQHRKQSTERPSAYISDADLWGIDDTTTNGSGRVPYLMAPPAPPRSAEQWLTQPFPQVAAGSWMAQRRISGAARKASAQLKKR